MKGLGYINVMVPSNLNIPRVWDFTEYVLGTERKDYQGTRNLKLVLGERVAEWGGRLYSKVTSQMIINML